MTIRRATLDDLDPLVPLFDAYRVFYRRPPDPEAARLFLRDRLERDESIIFLAIESSEAVAFTQLYPSFSSVSMARTFILNDLFVARAARRLGAGSALLKAAADFGRESGACRLVLSTEITNMTAQSVYERNGWTRDTAFFVYNLSLIQAPRP